MPLKISIDSLIKRDVNYIKYEEAIFNKRPGENIKSKQGSLFLLGESRQGPGGQENTYGEL